MALGRWSEATLLATVTGQALGRTVSSPRPVTQAPIDGTEGKLANNFPVNIFLSRFGERSSSFSDRGLRLRRRS